MNIGQLKFDKPLILAPMEDVTDSAFRSICRRLEADIVMTEFTSSEALIRDIPKAIEKVSFQEKERPLAIQIFGGVETSMEGAAARVAELKPDFIDINCGCWVKNHVARGEGAGLLKDLPRFEKIVKSTVRGTNLPVTVKTRLGWDEESIVIEDVARMVEDAGAKALTLHCRTRSQGHQGEARWEYLTKLKKIVDIPIIGNGDVNTPEDAKRMLETGCDGVMIGRGAISNPWIFKQTKHYLATGQHLEEPSLKEKIDTCLEHLALAIEIKGVKKTVFSFRKHYIGYLKGFPNVAQLRAELMKLVEFDDIRDCLYNFLDKHKNISLS